MYLNEGRKFTLLLILESNGTFPSWTLASHPGPSSNFNSFVPQNSIHSFQNTDYSMISAFLPKFYWQKSPPCISQLCVQSLIYLHWTKLHNPGGWIHLEFMPYEWQNSVISLQWNTFHRCINSVKSSETSQSQFQPLVNPLWFLALVRVHFISACIHPPSNMRQDFHAYAFLPLCFKCCHFRHGLTWEWSLIRKATIFN